MSANISNKGRAVDKDDLGESNVYSFLINNTEIGDDLKKLVIEMKIMNKHLAAISEMDITPRDVTEDDVNDY